MQLKYSNKSRWLMLIISCLSGMFSCQHFTSYASLLGIIAEQLGINPGRVGQLSTAALLGEAIFMALLGNAVDKMGVRFTLSMSGIITFVLFLTILLLPQSMIVLLICYFLLGVPSAFAWTSIGPICIEWFPQEQHGLASGIFYGCSMLGYGFGSAASPVLYKLMGNWRLALLCLSIFSLITSIFAFIFVRRSPRTEQSHHSRIQTNAAVNNSSKETSLLTVLFMPATLIGIFVLTISGFSQTSQTTYLAPFVSEASPLGLGYGPLLGGQATLYLTIFACIGSFIGGPLYDKYFSKKSSAFISIGFLLVITRILYFLPAVTESYTMVIIVSVISGLGITLITPSFNAVICKIYPSEYIGTASGLWWGMTTCCVSVLMFFNGISIELLDNFNFVWLLAILIAFVGILVVLAKWDKIISPIPKECFIVKCKKDKSKRLNS